MMFCKQIELLSKIENKTVDSEIIRKILKKCNFKEIDIFLLRLIVRNNIEVEDKEDIHFLFDDYCSKHLGRNIHNSGDFSINAFAEFAFEYKIKGKIFSEVELHQNPAWYIFNLNKELQYFLVAKHVVSSLQSIIDNPSLNFSFTYPHKINSYCKYFVNMSDLTQEQIFKGANIVLTKDEDYQAHANAMYLLGRLQSEVHIEKAKDVLYNYKLQNNKKKVKPEARNSLLLALRTCYISLACLGDTTASEEYIGQLMDKPQWCEINRGFHLLYYGDKDFNPGIGLIAKDNLEDFPKTYSYLFNRISNFTKKPLSDIEIYTFFSLIQHRFKNKKFNDSKKLSDVIDLIDSLLNDGLVEFLDLVSYLKILKDTFENQEFSMYSLMKEINYLKFEKRKGWIKRDFKEEAIETVASHTLNAVYIASLLLPEFYEKNPQEKCYRGNYNKKRILDMLLYHDLAECKIHDHIRGEKSQKTIEEEKLFFEKLSLYRTYGYANVKYISELWNEFEKGNTINAEIAREIDSLEAYAQLLYYLAAGEKICKEDFKNGMMKQKIIPKQKCQRK